MPNIQINTQTITQITVVDAEPEKQAEALSMMAERARFMARQPGFVSISLHRSLDGRRIVNYVQWQNRELLQQAHQSPDFRKAWGKFDDLTDQIDPHLYEVARSWKLPRSWTVLAEQRREIVARKVALKSATTQAGEFVHEEIRKVRRGEHGGEIGGVARS
jgi:quinol monooxygenase YgiN